MGRCVEVVRCLDRGSVLIGGSGLYFIVLSPTLKVPDLRLSRCGGGGEDGGARFEPITGGSSGHRLGLTWWACAMPAANATPRSHRRRRKPLCIVIAGPNGAGKTTFAHEFLPNDAAVVHFVNADLIASGLSPLRPQLAAAAAARLFLRELDRLAASKADFAFETTFSGLAYASKLRRWKRMGYRVEIVFLKISSPQLALRRIAARVRQGGHDVPREDVLRRFVRGWVRGWENFRSVYRNVADMWSVYDNSVTARSPTPSLA